MYGCKIHDKHTQKKNNNKKTLILIVIDQLSLAVVDGIVESTSQGVVRE